MNIKLEIVKKGMKQKDLAFILFAKEIENGKMNHKTAIHNMSRIVNGKYQHKLTDRRVEILNKVFGL